MSFLDLNCENVQHRSANLFLAKPSAVVSFLAFTSETYPLYALESVDSLGRIVAGSTFRYDDAANASVSVLSVVKFTQVYVNNSAGESTNSAVSVQSVVKFTQVYVNNAASESVNSSVSVLSGLLVSLAVNVDYKPKDEINSSVSVISVVRA